MAVSDSHSSVQSLAESGIAHIPHTYVRPLHERPKVPHNAFTRHDIPVIDLSQNQSCLVHQIGQACIDWGFFQIVNHGVPLQLMRRMMLAASQFFGLPNEEKLRYACTPSVVASEGYGSRMLTKEDQVLDWRDYFSLYTLPLSRRNLSNWPDTPTSYRQTMEKYSSEMKLLAQRLLAIISESLGLCSSYIEDAIGEPYQNVCLSFYPPCPQPELTLGLQSHSDMGAITLLMQDEVGGLQVCKDGHWLVVQPIPDALVVNLADQIEILSNGRYKSVEHRAVPNSSKARISVATFYDPSKATVISPALELIDTEHPVLYKSVLYGDHVSAWYSNGPEGKKVVDSLAIMT